MAWNYIYYFLDPRSMLKNGYLKLDYMCWYTVTELCTLKQKKSVKAFVVETTTYQTSSQYSKAFSGQEICSHFFLTHKRFKV